MALRQRNLLITDLTRVHTFIFLKMQDRGGHASRLPTMLERRSKMLSMAVSSCTASIMALLKVGLDLDRTHLRYSYKHSNLVTLTVDGQAGQQAPSPTTQEWHLPTFDPKNENKYMYKLHTVDLYFWTKEDALQFVSGIRRVLPAAQITILDEPMAPPPHHDDMSPVVQKLENVAISDPSYQHGQTRDSRATSNAFPGPPISATPQSQESANFAPMAYNPAAPAAPEAIKHREKTPPPEDGAANPLAAAATSDQGQNFTPAYLQRGFSGPPGQIGQPPQTSYFTGPPAPPPQQPPSQQQQAVSPFAQHFQHSFAAPPTAATIASPYAQPPPPASASAPPPPAYQQQTPAHIPVTQYANYPGSPHSSNTTPGIYSPGVSSPLTSPGTYTPGAPPGGFSHFQYNSTISNTQPLMTDYSIHQQVYRPTEDEAAHHRGKAAKPPKGKLEARAGQLEKGVGSLLKKLEKKIG
jgi:hypothetical protein